MNKKIFALVALSFSGLFAGPDDFGPQFHPHTAPSGHEVFVDRPFPQPFQAWDGDFGPTQSPYEPSEMTNVEPFDQHSHFQRPTNPSPSLFDARPDSVQQVDPHAQRRAEHGLGPVRQAWQDPHKGISPQFRVSRTPSQTSGPYQTTTVYDPFGHEYEPPRDNRDIEAKLEELARQIRALQLILATPGRSGHMPPMPHPAFGELGQNQQQILPPIGH